MGIWQHVWLEATGPVAVRDPAAMTEVRLPEGSEAAVTVRCQLENARPPSKTWNWCEIVPEAADGTPDGPAVEARTKVTLPPRKLHEAVLRPKQHPTSCCTSRGSGGP